MKELNLILLVVALNICILIGAYRVVNEIIKYRAYWKNPIRRKVNEVSKRLRRNNKDLEIFDIYQIRLELVDLGILEFMSDMLVPGKSLKELNDPLIEQRVYLILETLSLDVCHMRLTKPIYSPVPTFRTWYLIQKGREKEI